MHLTQLPRTIGQVDDKIVDCFRGLVTGRVPWPLFIAGPAGIGKTRAALALMDHCDWNSAEPPDDFMLRASVYYTVRRLCTDIIAENSGNSEKHPGRTWRSVGSAAIATLDEIGSRQQVSEFHYETVCEFLDLRECSPAIYLSNLRITELAKIYDDRVASRLASGTVLELEGPDRRIHNQ